MQQFPTQFRTEQFTYQDSDFTLINSIIDDKFNRAISLYNTVPSNVEIDFKEFYGYEVETLVINDHLAGLAFIRRNDFNNYELLLTIALQRTQVEAFNRSERAY